MESSEAPRSRKTTVKTNATYFGVTISSHTKTGYVDKSNLEAIMKTLKERLNTLNFLLIRYENSGKYAQLHMHALVKVRESFRYSQNCSIDGFHILWKKLHSRKDTVEWVNYCNKEAYHRFSQEQILAHNYYKHNYGFQ